jgi:hypothetical protein
LWKFGNKGGCDEIPLVEESCIWVEVHNDSKELVEGLKEVVNFAS